MNYNIKLSWKVLLTSSKQNSINLEKNNLFSIRTGKTFLKWIGGISNKGFSPFILEPTHVFYNAIELTKKANGFEGKKFPYSYIAEGFIDSHRKVNINIHMYTPTLFILFVSMESFETNWDVDKLVEMQRLESHRGLYNLARTICGLIMNGNQKNIEFQTVPKTFPCTIITSLNNQNIFSDSFAVEILTRHRNVKNEIIESVISKNSDHQLNSNSILIDRQGIFARFTQEFEIQSFRKYESAHRLFEFAIIISRIFSESQFEDLSVSKQNSIVEFINKPRVIFFNSVSARKTWELLIDEFHLAELYKQFKDNNDQQKESKDRKKSNWSDRKKWIMGIISVIFISILSWLWSILSPQVNLFSPEKIKITSPKDGTVINSNTSDILFKWESVEGKEHYILVIEIYDSKSNIWTSNTETWRYIVTKNDTIIKFKHNGRFRWKVDAKYFNDESKNESSWSYFEYYNFPPPNILNK